MENILIAVDSCCDLNADLCRILGAVSVPLSINIDGREIFDDEKLDADRLLEMLDKAQGKALSSFPSPDVFAEAFSDKRIRYCITISKQISGSYSSAKIASEISNDSGKVTVIDCKSGSAGGILAAVWLRKLINQGCKSDEIKRQMNEKIGDMKTYFSPENLNALKHSGRLGKMISGIVPALNIRPLLYAGSEGKIEISGAVRGKKHLIARLVEQIEKSGKKCEGEIAVITHCKAEELAKALKQEMQRKFKFADIIIAQTHGISTMYLQRGGIVLAF